MVPKDARAMISRTVKVVHYMTMAKVTLQM